MNAKQIKALKWHKKSLIDTLTREGVEVSDVDRVIESIIQDLDKIRDNRDPIKEARIEGYAAGYGAGFEHGRSKIYKWTKVDYIKINQES